MSSLIRDLNVETVPVSSLKPSARNPRTHSKKQLRQIADSIRTFGWTNPILIDAEGGVIAGHGRLEAAKRQCQSKIS
ncbi:MAG: ParB/Srx family N-terminal domain-containing protein [Hyphomicrobiales bacterium]|nr:ParB/Srx family N-terminal domain-containing protein [Hyphomicrobiales bacterium]